MSEVASLLISVYTLVSLMNNSIIATAVDYSSDTLPMLQTTNRLSGDTNHHGELFCFNSTTKVHNCSQVICSKGGPLLVLGCCATYSEDTRILSITICPEFQYNAYNVTNPGYIQLPRILTQLNDYMCGPLNRKGLVCSECADGFGPAVTSFWYTCANCTDVWYGVPLFLFLEFVPITVFYLIILVFQISVTSAPMPCFIMYAQFIVATLNISSKSSIRRVIFTKYGDLRLDMKIIHTFYGVFNLDFFHLVVPPFCISSKLKSIHIALLGYISVFYPMLLICLTWVSVELHDHNFRPLVCLWRPFHRCFVRLRRGWDTKSDIIDVFSTFFLLSYNRCIYQILLLLTGQSIVNYNEKGSYINMYHQTSVDLSITRGSTKHLLLVIPIAIICFIFNILPPLLLMLYPIKAFRLCLSKCRLDFIAINIYVDKVHGCYRNGLDRGRDMRSFSGLYFFLRMVAYSTGFLCHRILNHTGFLSDIWYPIGTVFLTVALVIALIKPYKKAYMNYLDTFILSDLSMLCYLMSSQSPILLLTVRILLLIPIATFIAIVLLRKFSKLYDFKALSQRCSNCCRLRTLLTRVQELGHPLIHVATTRLH